MKFPDTDFSIVEKLGDARDAAGWNSAWRRFFEIYHPLLDILARNSFAEFNFAGVQQAAIDDVVCDAVKALLDIFERQKFRRDAHFRGLLKSVVRNKTVDYMRKNKRLISAEEFGAKHEAEAAGLSETPPPFDSRESRAYMLARMMDAWEQVRTTLSPQTSAIFELVKIKGRTPRGVMEELGVSRTVVDNSVYKALKRLREKLSKIEKGEF